MQHYICGAQSAGKTTLISRLRLLPELLKLDGSIEVVEEVARNLIKEDGVEFVVFQDYHNHQEEFYQFNLKLVRRYLEMAKHDRIRKSVRRSVKLYDRSGVDAVCYIVTYLPHLKERMLAETEVQELLNEYASNDRITMIVIDPQTEFMVNDNVRLPPVLPELLSYTKNLRELLDGQHVRRFDLPEKDLEVRVKRVSEMILNDW